MFLRPEECYNPGLRLCLCAGVVPPHTHTHIVVLTGFFFILILIFLCILSGNFFSLHDVLSQEFLFFINS